MSAPVFPVSHLDLLGAQVATFATIDDDDLPQLTEVWFLVEDGQIQLSLNTARHKTQNIAKRPQCSLLILDPVTPYRYLEVRGHARVEPDDDYAFARKVGAKYDADLEVHDGPGDKRVVVTIEPAKIHPVDMRG